MRCLVSLGGFPLILGKKAQISLGHVGGGGKPAGRANFQLCCSWDCVWQGLLWLSRTHLHLLSFQGEKGKPAGPQMPSALSWWASAIKRVFSNCILSWVWCLPSFSLSNKKLAFLYNFYTKKLWDLVGFFFFHCTGRAAVSGQGRSVICSWILGPWSCVRPLCSLGLCWEAAAWAGIQCPLEEPLKFSSLALKPFLQAMTFILPFLLYPHNLILSQIFSLFLKKEKCSTAGTS